MFVCSSTLAFSSSYKSCILAVVSLAREGNTYIHAVIEYDTSNFKQTVVLLHNVSPHAGCSLLSIAVDSVLSRCLQCRLSSVAFGEGAGGSVFETRRTLVVTQFSSTVNLNNFGLVRRTSGRDLRLTFPFQTQFSLSVSAFHPQRSCSIFS